MEGMLRRVRKNMRVRKHSLMMFSVAKVSGPFTNNDRQTG